MQCLACNAGESTGAQLEGNHTGINELEEDNVTTTPPEPADGDTSTSTTTGVGLTLVLAAVGSTCF